MKSILIKGMEMPKDCHECRFCDLTKWAGYCSALQKSFDRIEGFENRLPDCPLKEVPVSHGRLIDADKMRNEESERYATMMFGLADTKELPSDVVFLLNEAVRRQVIALIESMPTVIEAEE